MALKSSHNTFCGFTDLSPSKSLENQAAKGLVAIQSFESSNQDSRVLIGFAEALRVSAPKVSYRQITNASTKAYKIDLNNTGAARALIQNLFYLRWLLFVQRLAPATLVSRLGGVIQLSRFGFGMGCNAGFLFLDEAVCFPHPLLYYTHICIYSQS
jgi:hypothetical protein